MERFIHPFTSNTLLKGEYCKRCPVKLKKTCDVQGTDHFRLESWTSLHRLAQYQSCLLQLSANKINDFSITFKSLLKKKKRIRQLAIRGETDSMWSCHASTTKTKTNKNIVIKVAWLFYSSFAIIYYSIIAIDEWNDPEWWKSYKQFFQIVFVASWLFSNKWMRLSRIWRIIHSKYFSVSHWLKACA